MQYIDTVVVNGTEYGVIDRGGAYNVACRLGTADCTDVVLPTEPDGNVEFCTIETPQFAWMRTGEEGSYEYSLVALSGETAPENLTYYPPTIEPSA